MIQYGLFDVVFFIFYFLTERTAQNWHGAPHFVQTDSHPSTGKVRSGIREATPKTGRTALCTTLPYQTEG